MLCFEKVLFYIHFQSGKVLQKLLLKCWLYRGWAELISANLFKSILFSLFTDNMLNSSCLLLDRRKLPIRAFSLVFKHGHWSSSFLALLPTIHNWRHSDHEVSLVVGVFVEHGRLSNKIISNWALNYIDLFNKFIQMHKTDETHRRILKNKSDSLVGIPNKKPPSWSDRTNFAVFQNCVWVHLHA